MEAAAARFAKLKHLWLGVGYRGELVAWIKQHLGWSVEVVLPPRCWGSYPEGVEPPPAATFTRQTVLPAGSGFLGGGP